MLYTQEIRRMFHSYYLGDVIAVLSIFTAVYRPNVSYIIRNHNNSTPNTAQILSIPSIGLTALYIGQNIIDMGAEHI